MYQVYIICQQVRLVSRVINPKKKCWTEVWILSPETTNCLYYHAHSETDVTLWYTHRQPQRRQKVCSLSRFGSLVSSTQQASTSANTWHASTSTSTSTWKLYLSTDQVPVPVPSTTRLSFIGNYFVICTMQSINIKISYWPLTTHPHQHQTTFSTATHAVRKQPQMSTACSCDSFASHHLCYSVWAVAAFQCIDQVRTTHDNAITTQEARDHVKHFQLVCNVQRLRLHHFYCLHSQWLIILSYRYVQKCHTMQKYVIFSSLHSAAL